MTLKEGPALRHHPNAIFALALVLLAGAALVAGCGSKDEQEAPATEITVGSKMGNMAPEFTLERVSGGQLTLSSLRGKAVIVDFWDTWCPPCKKSLPDLQENGAEDKITFSQIAKLRPSFWFVSLLCVTFYSAIFPFTALSTDFFVDKWGVARVAVIDGSFFKGVFGKIKRGAQPGAGQAGRALAGGTQRRTAARTARMRGHGAGAPALFMKRAKAGGLPRQGEEA